jgi:hypothetical protein
VAGFVTTERLTTKTQRHKERESKRFTTEHTKHTERKAEKKRAFLDLNLINY